MDIYIDQWKLYILDYIIMARQSRLLCVFLQPPQCRLPPPIAPGCCPCKALPGAFDHFTGVWGVQPCNHHRGNKNYHALTKHHQRKLDGVDPTDATPP